MSGRPRLPLGPTVFHMNYIAIGTAGGGENVQGQAGCSAGKGYCQADQNVRRKVHFFRAAASQNRWILADGTGRVVRRTRGRLTAPCKTRPSRGSHTFGSGQPNPSWHDLHGPKVLSPEARWVSVLQRPAAGGPENRYYTGFRGQGSWRLPVSPTGLSFRFTVGAAAPLEKKKAGPSQADVEAIKVRSVPVVAGLDAGWGAPGASQVRLRCACCAH